MADANEVIIVGYGAAGSRHFMNAAATGARIVAVADPKFAGQKAEGVYSSTEQCLRELANKRVVIVASPNEFHHAHAMMAIDHGCHGLLIEKPMALNANEAEEIAQATSVLGVRAAIAHNYRYHAAIQQVIATVEDIGMHVLQVAALDNVQRWSAYNKGQGYMMQVGTGGVLLTSGSHAVDLAIFFGGQAARLVCVHKKDKNNLDIEFLLRIMHLSGSISTIYNRWENTDEYSTFGIVTGTKSSFVDLRAYEQERTLMHQRMMKAFMEYVQGGPEGFLCLPDQGHAVMVVLDAARENWETGATVDIMGGYDVG